MTQCVIVFITFPALRRTCPMTTGPQKRQNACINVLWKPPRSVAESVRRLFNDLVITTLEELFTVRHLASHYPEGLGWAREIRQPALEGGYACRCGPEA